MRKIALIEGIDNRDGYSSFYLKTSPHDSNAIRTFAKRRGGMLVKEWHEHEVNDLRRICNHLQRVTPGYEPVVVFCGNAVHELTVLSKDGVPEMQEAITQINYLEPDEGEWHFIGRSDLPIMQQSVSWISENETGLLSA